MGVLESPGRSQSCQWDRWPGSGLGKQPLEILGASPKPHKEISHVAAIADIGRKLHNLRVRNHARDAQRTLAACLVAVEAYVDFGNFGEYLGPLFLERAGAAGRGNGLEAVGFEHQPVELALADDCSLRLEAEHLPAVEVNVRASRRKHFRAVALVVRVFGKTE